MIWSIRTTNGRRIARPLVVLAVAAMAGGYLLGRVSTLAGGALDPPAAETAETAVAAAGRMVVVGDGAALRDAPQSDAVVVGRVAVGTAVMVVDGPIIRDGVAWYLVDAAGATGWSSDASLAPSRRGAGSFERQEFRV